MLVTASCNCSNSDSQNKPPRHASEGLNYWLALLPLHDCRYLHRSRSSPLLSIAVQSRQRSIQGDEMIFNIGFCNNSIFFRSHSAGSQLRHLTSSILPSMTWSLFRVESLSVHPYCSLQCPSGISNASLLIPPTSPSFW